MRGLLVILAAIWTCSAWTEVRPKRMMDLPPDATSAQLRRALTRNGFSAFGQQNPMMRTVIDEAIDLGVRNLNWLKYINDRRGENDKISLTSAATTNGIPIDKPTEYSPKIIQERLDKLRAEIPQEMREVLFENKAFTPDVPFEQDKFIEWGRKTDGLYQTAMRWRGMQPYLNYLERARREDVRGIYYFNKEDQSVLRGRLANPSGLSPEEKTNYNEWLISMCLNNGATLATCRGQVKDSFDSGQSLLPLYEGWQPAAQNTWDEFFGIQNPRPEVQVSTPQLLEMPFQDPNDAVVMAYLRDNIEDEWKFGGWQLRLQFSATAPVHIVFSPGETPHVNGLGGDEITMDANQPLTEYDAQWTIRHEFGHVLGLPDCYVEFYDVDRQSIINYQLDIDNLMCSRHGHIQQKHVDELQKVYSIPSVLAH